MAVAAAPTAAPLEDTDAPTVAASAPAPAPAPTANVASADVSPAPTSDADDRSYLMAVGKGFVVGTVIWAALIFAIMYLVADIAVGESIKWALWIGPWGGLFLGGTFTVGFWSEKHH